MKARVKFLFILIIFFNRGLFAMKLDDVTTVIPKIVCWFKVYINNEANYPETINEVLCYEKSNFDYNVKQNFLSMQRDGFIVEYDNKNKTITVQKGYRKCVYCFEKDLYFLYIDNELVREFNVE